MSPHIIALMNDEVRMALADLAACAKELEAQIGRKALLDLAVSTFARRSVDSPIKIVCFRDGSIGLGIK